MQEEEGTWVAVREGRISIAKGLSEGECVESSIESKSQKGRMIQGVSA